jgi:hypothetical protein
MQSLINKEVYTDEETLERGTEGVTRHHKIPQRRNVEQYARGPQDFVGSQRKLEKFLLHKKKKKKMGVGAVKRSETFCQGDVCRA